MDELVELISKASDGDSESFETIYKNFSKMALQYAYSLLGDMDLAEDVKQEAFLTAYCDLVSLRNPKAFPGWLKKIVHKHCVQIRRKNKIIAIPIEEEVHSDLQVIDSRKLYEEKELSKKLNKGIENLPTKEKELIRLCYFDGLSYRAAGSEIGIPEKTVKSRLYGARINLKNQLWEVVREKVGKQNPVERQKITNKASHEAILMIDKELDQLLSAPTVQEKTTDLICAKGRLLRFMGKSDSALKIFNDAINNRELNKISDLKNRFKIEMGLTLIQQSKFDEATKHLKSSHKFFQKRGQNISLMACIQNALGICGWAKGNWLKAERHYQKAYEISDEINLKEIQAEALNNLALLSWKKGELDFALKQFRECRKKWGELKNRFGYSITQMNIGIIEENQGKMSLAKKHYEEALALAEELNFVQLKAVLKTNLSSLAINQKKWELAMELSNEAIQLSKETKDLRNELIAWENQALAQIGTGQFDSATSTIKKIKNIAAGYDDSERNLSIDLLDLELQIEMNRLQQVTFRLENLSSLIHKRKYKSEFPRFLRLIAIAEIKNNEIQEAKKTIQKGLKESHKQNNRVEEARFKLLLKKIHGIDKN